MSKYHYPCKTKLYNVAKRYYTDLPKMKECDYHFHRGSAWLDFRHPKTLNKILVFAHYCTGDPLIRVSEEDYNEEKHYWYEVFSEYTKL